MDVYKITPLEYGYLSVIGTVVSTLGIFAYQIWFKHSELRNLTLAANAVFVFTYIVSLLQALRYNIAWGISDFTTCAFSGIIASAVVFPLNVLPCLVMFQRLTPMNVETTMIAFAASLLNMANGVVGKFSGIFINLFIGVSKDDL